MVALSFYSAIDFPERFRKGEDVGAYFGLTPRQFQSGETDFTVGISKRSEKMVRHHLVIAATLLMTATKKWCPLKAWGVRVAMDSVPLAEVARRLGDSEKAMEKVYGNHAPDYLRCAVSALNFKPKIPTLN